jgi:hypothetical protein
MPMRLTDLWTRLEMALGPGYAHSWASDHVLSSLGGLTVEQAIAAGDDTQLIWRAVHAELGLHPSDR